MDSESVDSAVEVDGVLDNLETKELKLFTVPVWKRPPANKIENYSQYRSPSHLQRSLLGTTMLFNNSW